MIQAIAYAIALMFNQPVFCKETLAWDANPLAIGYHVSMSFVGPDGKTYFQHYETDTARCELITPYDRPCMVTVGAVYKKENGDVYILTSEPFEFEGCASKKRKQ